MHIRVKSIQEHLGQGLIEYALILVLIALVAIVILRVFGSSLGGVFSQIGSQITNY
jgi:pilus assembly protein Flp/PilA